MTRWEHEDRLCQFNKIFIENDCTPEQQLAVDIESYGLLTDSRIILFLGL